MAVIKKEFDTVIVLGSEGVIVGEGVDLVVGDLEFVLVVFGVFGDGSCEGE